MDYDFGLCSNQIELQSKGIFFDMSRYLGLHLRLTRWMRVSKLKIVLTSSRVACYFAENQTKCFENMLDLINLTYFGSSQSV